MRVAYDFSRGLFVPFHAVIAAYSWCLAQTQRGRLVRLFLRERITKVISILKTMKLDRTRIETPSRRRSATVREDEDGRQKIILPYLGIEESNVWSLI
jgi:hypothetical protein